MKILIIILIIFSIKSEIDTSKMLIIYFSRTGNTELFANYIKECLNIDSYRIIPINEYPSESQIMTDLAKAERKYNYRPEIRNPITNISNYNKILLGYPIWNSYLPCIVITQLLKINFSGKTIYPFNTHENSELGNSIKDIRLYTPGAIVKKGFPIKGSQIRNNKEESLKRIKQWLNINFGYLKNIENICEIKLINILFYIFLI